MDMFVTDSWDNCSKLEQFVRACCILRVACYVPLSHYAFARALPVRPWSCLSHAVPVAVPPYVPLSY